MAMKDLNMAKIEHVVKGNYFKPNYELDFV